MRTLLTIVSFVALSASACVVTTKNGEGPSTPAAPPPPAAGTGEHGVHARQPPRTRLLEPRPRPRPRHARANADGHAAHGHCRPHRHDDADGPDLRHHPGGHRLDDARSPRPRLQGDGIPSWPPRTPGAATRASRRRSPSWFLPTRPRRTRTKIPRKRRRSPRRATPKLPPGRSRSSLRTRNEAAPAAMPAGSSL